MKERLEATVGTELPTGWMAVEAGKALVHKLGWGVVSIIAALVVVGVAAPHLAAETVGATLRDLIFLSPYLAAAFALAGYTKAAGSDALLTRVFRGHRVLMVFAATAVGAMTPLCSCSVVALIAVLLRSGTPLSAVMAFWIASPIISPDLFIYTAGVLGFELATARLLAALFMGVSVGLITLLVETLGGFKAPLRGGEIVRVLPPGEILKPQWRFWREPERVRIFWQEFKSAGSKILPWLILAFFLENLFTAFVPTALVAKWVGGSSPWAIPLSMVASVATYINPVAAVPVVSGLLSLGMTKAAALAYIVVGSVTTIPAMLAVLPLVRMRVFAWHLGMGMITGAIAAYAYQLFSLL